MDDPRVKAVSALLTKSGEARFYEEIYGALIESKRTDNLRSLQDTIDAWFRSAIFAAQPNFQANLELLDEPFNGEGEAILTSDGIRERLGI